MIMSNGLMQTLAFYQAKGKPIRADITTWLGHSCLLYTSDAADDLLCVDLGGRRIIKKKKTITNKSKVYLQKLHDQKQTQSDEVA